MKVLAQVVTASTNLGWVNIFGLLDMLAKAVLMKMVKLMTFTEIQ